MATAQTPAPNVKEDDWKTQAKQKLVNGSFKPNVPSSSVHVIIEQYKLFAELADRVSTRRMQVNTFFLTLHTAVLGGLGYGLTNNILPPDPVLLVAILIVLSVLCVAWTQMVNSYRKLNSAKWEIVAWMENELPIRPWAAEWKLLGEGRVPARYRQVTKVEDRVPNMFLLVYAVSILYVLGLALTPVVIAGL